MTILEVRVNGRAINTYSHEGKTYIEGRKGSKYTLHYHNNTSRKKKIVLSVDGLNVMTGDTNWDRGYVIEPWQTIDVPGWRKDANTVADFNFSNVKSTYNQLNDEGEKKNIGVIGCMIFDEKQQAIPNTIVWNYYWPNTIWVNPNQYSSYTVNYQGVGKTLTNSVGPISANYMAFVGQNSSSPLKKEEEALRDRPRSMEAVENSIGTGWGSDTEFKTVSVHFDAEGLPSETIILYYDERQGLMKRGVIQSRRPEHKQEAFPGYKDGCPNPKYR